MRKKIVLWLLCICVCVSLWACSDNEASGKESVTCDVTENTDPNAPSLPSPSEVDISGDFTILVSGNWEWNDFESEGLEGNVVETAIYKRNEMLKNKYNVNIVNEDIVAYGSAMGTGKGYVKIYTEYMSGGNTYDAAMLGTYDAATLAYNGCLMNLNGLKYVDLSKPYWDRKATADLSMNGKIYYTTGDISVADNRSTNALFFNKAMIDMYGLDDPYELVRDGKWTLEKFGQLVKSVGTDENNDGIYDKNDTFGLLSARDNNLAMLAAAGEKICTINEDGHIELTLYNERTVNLYDRYIDIVGDDTHTFNWQYNYITGDRATQATSAERIGMLNNNRALFYFHMMFYVDEMRDIETDFGILPFPKYDEAQEEYGHYISAWHSQFLCVPKTTPNPEKTGIVLEELAYQGKELLTPAYYEKTLVGQRTRDAESIEMLDIIFATRVYDVGVYYTIGGYKDHIGNLLETGSSLTTVYETYRPAAENLINVINGYFDKASGN